jgi:hypothetical protein
MATFGIMGMIFGLAGWFNSQVNTTELPALKKELRESGGLKDNPDPARKEQPLHRPHLIT